MTGMRGESSPHLSLEGLTGNALCSFRSLRPGCRDCTVLFIRLLLRIWLCFLFWLSCKHSRTDAIVILRTVGSRAFDGSHHLLATESSILAARRKMDRCVRSRTIIYTFLVLTLISIPSYGSITVYLISSCFSFLGTFIYHRFKGRQSKASEMTSAN